MDPQELIAQLEAELAQLQHEQQIIREQTARVLAQLPEHLHPAPIRAEAQAPRPHTTRETCAWLGRTLPALRLAVRAEHRRMMAAATELDRWRGQFRQAPTTKPAPPAPKPMQASTARTIDIASLPPSAFHFSSGFPVRVITGGKQ